MVQPWSGLFRSGLGLVCSCLVWFRVGFALVWPGSGSFLSGLGLQVFWPDSGMFQSGLDLVCSSMGLAPVWSGLAWV